MVDDQYRHQHSVHRTPNGQEALLVLLTSALAVPIQLGYLTMMKMALPYTLTMTTVSLLAVWLLF